MLRRTLVTALAVLGFATFGPMPNVYGADVTLYEVTENMKMKTFARQLQSVTARVATSALTGTAEPGTPLCPLPVKCIINATGSDNINVATGLGTFSGKWSTVVPGDNAVDAPEFEVLKGTFQGMMDFSPALLYGLPYGTVTGELRQDVKHGRAARYPFTGVFYLPFVSPYDPTSTPLYLSGLPSPDGWNVVPINPAKEYSIGYPTVKFEITFGAR